jgi:hypothetical protein
MGQNSEKGRDSEQDPKATRREPVGSKCLAKLLDPETMLINLHTSQTPHQSPVAWEHPDVLNPDDRALKNEPSTVSMAGHQDRIRSQLGGHQPEAKVWCARQAVEPRTSICMLHEDRRIDVEGVGDGIYSRPGNKSSARTSKGRSPKQPFGCGSEKLPLQSSRGSTCWSPFVEEGVCIYSRTWKQRAGRGPLTLR